MPYRTSQKRRTTTTSFVVGLGVLLLGAGFVAQAAENVFISGDDDGASVSQDDVRGIRGFVAEDSEQPSVRMQVTPEGLVSPGRDVTLVSIPENYGDVNEFHTTWCIDKIPFTHIGAGSEDRLVIKDGERSLENEYGRIEVPENGYAICDSAFLNELGGFKTGEFTGGVVGDEDTKAIPAYPDLSKTRPQYPPFDADNWSYFRRIPNVDTDNDGLDDEWEVRYFSGRIRPISERGEEARDVPLAEKVYPVVREEVLRLVRPQDDPDRDGWDWGFDYDEMSLVAGVRLRPFQPTEAQPNQPVGYVNDPNSYDILQAVNPYSFAWQLGIPYVSIPQDRVDAGTAGFGNATVLGMGEWNGSDDPTGCTNLEEYTFGTDPLSADTDGDDVSDCRDIAGQQQNSLTFPVDKKAGESYDIDMNAFTLNSQWRTAQLDSFPLPQNGLEGGFPRPSRYTELHSRKYVRIDFEEELQLSPSKGFEVKLDQEPDVVTTKTTGRLGQERIRMNAIAVLSDADETTLEYNWFLNGTYQEEASGAGKRFFFFNVDDPLSNGDVVNACEKHSVTINLVDPATENSASAQLNVEVNPPIEFTKEIVGHVERSRLGVDVQNYDASADTADVNKGARTGDIVRFTANILGLAESKDAAEDGDAAQQTCAEKGITLDQLTYKWS
ncbi:MAG: hypothetical protein KC653_02355, partial [Candidatus Andersenbacteria bacterium]|nr:hypothetical protein [Candidatus Andersenbacteria bacterium]